MIKKIKRKKINFMIKKILIMFLLITMSGCSIDLNKNDSAFDLINNNIENNKGENIMTNIKVKINDNIYNASIENNETAQKFMSKLPLTLNMNELNGNEKYYYLDESLPNNPIKPTTINKGDIMLFGNDCLVVFYKTFNTSYSYTKIGHIENMPDLDDNSVVIEFNIY